MNKITHHVPTFVDISGKPKVVEFNTLEELLRVDFVKKWAGQDGFHQFSLDAINGNLLMAELDDGDSWYVVGVLQDAVPGLPTWKG